jgi:hypothetical protein
MTDGNGRRFQLFRGRTGAGAKQSHLCRLEAGLNPISGDNKPKQTQFPGVYLIPISTIKCLAWLGLRDAENWLCSRYSGVAFDDDSAGDAADAWI